MPILKTKFVISRNKRNAIMNNIRFIYLGAFLLLIGISFSGCSESEPDKIQYTSFSLADKTGNCDSVGVGCAEFQVSYPIITGTEHAGLQKSLQAAIDTFTLRDPFSEGNTFHTSLQALRDSLFRDFNRVKLDIPDMPLNYFLQRIVTPVTDTLGLFSIRMSESSFFGGAHPNSFTDYRNISAADGTVITLEKILKKDGMKKFLALAENTFRKKMEVPEGENLEKAGFFFKDGVFVLSQAYLFTIYGIELLYNPYEAAAYAVGPISLKIPYEQWKDLIEPESVIGKLVK